jgi:hypothetical protein
MRTTQLVVPHGLGLHEDRFIMNCINGPEVVVRGLRLEGVESLSRISSMVLSILLTLLIKPGDMYVSTLSKSILFDSDQPNRTLFPFLQLKPYSSFRSRQHDTIISP